ncbi:helix-turn-helix domain-containing protein [Streptomyces rochei]|uniref:helix-turn-helix transcriptional regulator n=1 Tax=Streptomyces rochei TaxID=1928 RepID=UPI002ACEACFF|nr:helix-turn-helix domain-containing protein [Streptomyces rochei]WQC12623.1 helix-turn-helix domain-containing protein [Streptomyces rochei]
MPRPAKVPPPPPAGYLWTPEAARRIGLSVKTLWNYAHLGKGPQPRRIGRKLAYKISELDEFLANQLNAEPDPDRTHESRPAEPRTTRRPARAAA